MVAMSVMNSRAGGPCGLRLSAVHVAVALWALGAGMVRAQSMEVDPPSSTIFSFAGVEGGPFTPETATTWTLDNADARSLEFVASSNQRWLKIAPIAGSLPGSLVGDRTRSVTAELDAVEAAKMAPGTYSATVTFSNLTNEIGNTTRTVRLRVAAGSFSTTPSFVNLTASVNGVIPAPVVVTLRASGLLDLNYRLSWVGRSWFNVDKFGGTIPGGGTDTFTITFNTFGLTPGSQTAQISIENTTNGAGSRQLPINLVMAPSGAGVVVLRPDVDLEARGPEGNIPTVTQTSILVNLSDSVVTWDASSDESFVSVTPSGGVLAASNGATGGPDEIAIDFRVNAAADDLKAGTHSAAVTIRNVSNPAVPVNIGTRVVLVVVDSVLHASVPSPGGSIVVQPSGATVAGGTSSILIFPFGEVVTLTADPATGNSFLGWAADFDLDSEFENPLVVVLDDSRHVSAVFAPILQTLTLSSQGRGTGTVTSTPTAEIIDSEVSFQYNSGTPVTLLADADAGSVFVRWEGNVPVGDETDNPLVVVVDRDRTISARFEQSVALELDVFGGGEVVVDPDKDEYFTGETVTLRAVADAGFSFSGWSGGASGSASPLTLTLSDDTVVEARFVAGGGGDGEFELTVEIEGDGTVTPDGGSFEEGETVTLIATPDVGASFVGWELDAAGEELATSVTMSTDRTVRAVFTVVPDDGSTPRPNPLNGLCGATGLVELSMISLGLAGFRGVRGRRFSGGGKRSEG